MIIEQVWLTKVILVFLKINCSIGVLKETKYTEVFKLTFWRIQVVKYKRIGLATIVVTFVKKIQPQLFNHQYN